MRWVPDKETRVLIGLVIGLHWVDIIKPVIPGAVMIWEKLELEKPVNIFELRDLVKRHCLEIVSVA